MVSYNPSPVLKKDSSWSPGHPESKAGVAKRCEKAPKAPAPCGSDDKALAHRMRRRRPPQWELRSDGAADFGVGSDFWKAKWGF